MRWLRSRTEVATSLVAVFKALGGAWVDTPLPSAQIRAIPMRPAMMESRYPQETPEELEERLNEALDETFPASDPIAVHREDRGDDPDAESKTSQGR